MTVDLKPALKAYNEQITATGVPAHALFAAAAALDLPVAETFNLLLASGDVVIEFYKRPGHKDGGGVRVVRVLRKGEKL